MRRSEHRIRLLTGGSVPFRILLAALVAAAVVDVVRAHSGGRIAVDILVMGFVASALREGGWLTDNGIREQKAWRLRSTLVPWEAIKMIDVVESDRPVRSLRITTRTGETVDLFRSRFTRRSSAKLVSLIRTEVECRAFIRHLDGRPPDTT
jgi:hypothetical protein